MATSYWDCRNLVNRRFSPSRMVTVQIFGEILKKLIICYHPNQDEYFRKNLPSSYGSVSVEPPPSSAGGGEDGQYSSVEQSIFSGEVRKCSMGFQEMSRNLRALGNGSRDAIRQCREIQQFS